MNITLNPQLPPVSYEEWAAKVDASRKAAREALRRAYYEGK